MSDALLLMLLWMLLSIGSACNNSSIIHTTSSNKKQVEYLHIAEYINALYDYYSEEIFTLDKGEYIFKESSTFEFDELIQLDSRLAEFRLDVNGTGFNGIGKLYFLLITTDSVPTILKVRQIAGEAMLSMQQEANAVEEEILRREKESEFDKFKTEMSYNALFYEYPEGPFGLYPSDYEFDLSIEVFQLRDKQWTELTVKDYWHPSSTQVLKSYLPLLEIRNTEEEYYYPAFNLTITPVTNDYFYENYAYFKDIFGDTTQHDFIIDLKAQDQQFSLQYSASNQLVFGWQNHQLTIISTPSEKPDSTKLKKCCWNKKSCADRTWQGTIDEDSITMQLSFELLSEDSLKVAGQYWISDLNKHIQLKGIAQNQANGAIQLIQQNNKEYIEYFYGYFHNNFDIIGNWGVWIDSLPSANEIKRFKLTQ